MQLDETQPKSRSSFFLNAERKEGMLRPLHVLIGSLLHLNSAEFLMARNSQFVSMPPITVEELNVGDDEASPLFWRMHDMQNALKYAPQRLVEWSEPFWKEAPSETASLVQISRQLDIVYLSQAKFMTMLLMLHGVLLGLLFCTFRRQRSEPILVSAEKNDEKV